MVVDGCLEVFDWGDYLRNVYSGGAVDCVAIGVDIWSLFRMCVVGDILVSEMVVVSLSFVFCQAPW